MSEFITEPEVPPSPSSSSSSSPSSSSSSFVVSGDEETRRAMVRLVRLALVSFVPGAAQGATTVLLGHPLDTAKVRMQAAGPNVANTTFGTMWAMASTEGLRSLYRGVAPPLIMEGAKRSLQFALWDWLRAFAAAATAAAASSQEASTTPVTSALVSVQRAGHQTLACIGGNTFLSGALSGGIGTLIGCPMHVIKIQTQYQTARDTRNAWTCMRGIYQKEGVRGYYRGFGYNVLKDVCFAGTYLGLYATFRDRAWFEPAAQADAMATTTTTGGPRASPTGAFLSGATASMATWVLLYPLDTVKTLVQARQAHTIPFVVRRPAQLYRGLMASLLKAGPVSGVSMAVYELTWNFMARAAV